MPIIFPIEGETQPAAAATFAAAFGLTASPTVEQRGRGLLPLSFGLTAGGATLVQGAAELALATGLGATGRLNDEPNVFGAAELALTTGAAAAGGTAVAGTGVAFGVRLGLTASGTLARGEEFGFTIFLDILGDEVSNAGNVRRYAARLVADGVEVPISSYDLSAPEGALGVSLSVTLARADVSLVTSASALSFDLGVWSGGALTWVTLLAGGRLAGRGHSIAFAQGRPADAVTLQIVDAAADRWTLRPAAPETLYDPDQVDEPGEPDDRLVIRDEAGAKIVPVSTPVSGLTMREVLRRAYVEGCGFSEVVTNIPDFAVASAAFTLEGGYHGGASALLALFEPVYVAVGDVLWIVDAGAPLPAGLAARELPLSAVIRLDDTLPASRPVGSIIVECREDGRAEGDYFTERVEQETSESGSFGVPGSTKTETERRVREYRREDAPEIIVREETASVETRTLDAVFEVLGRETEVVTFDALGRKSGHKRTVEALVPDLTGVAERTLQTVTEERYTVIYRPTGREGVDEIARTVTEQSGLVLLDHDKHYFGRPYELPYVDAHHSGYIDPDANQSTEFRAIRTVEETYVHEGGAVRVRRASSSHLNGGSTETSTSQTRAGSVAVNRRTQGVVRRLLRAEGVGEDDEQRIVPSFSGGDLPGDLALEMGARKLKYLNSPPRELAAQLPYHAFDLRRGAVVRPHARSGHLGTYVVTALRGAGRELGSARQLVSMSVSGREMK